MNTPGPSTYWNDVCARAAKKDNAVIPAPPRQPAHVPTCRDCHGQAIARRMSGHACGRPGPDPEPDPEPDPDPDVHEPLIDQDLRERGPRPARDALFAERLEADVVSACVEVRADNLGDLLRAAMWDDRVDQPVRASL